MAGRDFLRHPSIADCCSGLMAHKDTPDSLRAELQEFRPRPLEGLEVWWKTEFEFFDGRPHGPIKVLGGFSWSTPEMIASELQSLIRGRQRVCKTNCTSVTSRSPSSIDGVTSATQVNLELRVPEPSGFFSPQIFNPARSNQMDGERRPLGGGMRAFAEGSLSIYVSDFR